ncbi:hypothetical protein EC915_11031 [Pseudomonas sp. LP_7_YM]|nr:hypothetical protein EC915_11031 [Pseudomonas sp. LP_7_YM]
MGRCCRKGSDRSARSAWERSLQRCASAWSGRRASKAVLPRAAWEQSSTCRLSWVDAVAKAVIVPHAQRGNAAFNAARWLEWTQSVQCGVTTRSVGTIIRRCYHAQRGNNHQAVLPRAAWEQSFAGKRAPTHARFNPSSRTPTSASSRRCRRFCSRCRGRRPQGGYS